ncbi:centlein-like isoform X2 [Nematostella vectensis]|uniref:centlein-like isoform X2 n=1 Tax=Nematostella vectensis TaxID=45351 RepID=UPI00207749C7|nr:centlein-like isoform X2 [Nematostella vectensis]
MEEQERLATKLEAVLDENQSLREELTQMRVDKEFVWNLWKRLQAAKPDLASVISMVVSREKEKTEKKDKKILQILKMKDEKIKEMREALDDAVSDLKQTKERFHDLLIENDELKQKQDAKESEILQRAKEAEEKNEYLSQLVKAYQDEKEKGSEETRKTLETIENEKNGLKSQIQNLESEIGKLSADRLSFDNMIKTNSTLQDKIQVLQDEMDELAAKTQQLEKEHEGAISTLKLRESQLQENQRNLQFMSGEVKDRERENIQLRSEVAELKTENEKALDHIRDQTAVIEQLQRMQEQLHRVMADRKQVNERDAVALQKSVADLRARCAEGDKRENQLMERIEALRESDERHIRELTSKDQLIDELRKRLENASQASAVLGNSHRTEACPRCRESKDKLEDVEMERDELREMVNEKTRRISSLERTLKTSLATNKRKSDPRPSTTSPGQVSPLHGEERERLDAKVHRMQAKHNDLRKLLDLKDSELAEVRKAHAQRQKRYRLLKDNLNLVQSQLRTYEKEPKESSPIERPAERALRHHNSDGVWNELTHYKTEYEKLEKERHDVLEELDVLRMQHANDLTTIQELRVCLQEEKENLLYRLTEEEKKQETRLSREARKYDKQDEELAVWKEKAVRYEKRAVELEEDVDLGKQEIESLRKELDNSKKDHLSLERRLEATEHELRQRVTECDQLRDDMDELQRRHIHVGSRDVAEEDTQSTGLASSHGAASPEKRRLEQQAKDINQYDKQLKKIAEKILSPSKQAKEYPQKGSQPPLRASHGTQTLASPRTADFSVTVDMGGESTEEGEDGMGSDLGMIGGRGKDTSRVVVQKTPRSKPKGMPGRRTPARGEWASMKQRILSLTQQVAALRVAKDKAIKSASDEKTASENLRAELSIVLQRMQVSKNTIQTLSEDLKKCLREKEALIVEREEYQGQGNDEELRRVEERLKASSAECSRLVYNVKNLRTENKDLKDKLQEAQERVTRVEHDVNQKKTLIEELRNKLRKAQSMEDKEANTVKDFEEKIRRLTERDSQRKGQVDSLKRQLDAETRDKDKWQQQYYTVQEELMKKARMLSETRALRGQAEIAVSEIEAAATRQLQGLANQSHATISALQAKLERANGKVQEFQAFVQSLVDEQLSGLDKMARAAERMEEAERRDQQRKPSSQQARDTACSILNLTSNDLDEMMRDDNTMENERLARKKRENEWRKRLDHSLKKEVPFASSLVGVLLDIIEERLALARRHAKSTKPKS